MQYGLLGRRLGHSYSREIHALVASYDYGLLELEPDEVGPFLRRREFRGINVTIPYKESVIPFLDWVSPSARSVGAVNTVVNRGGMLLGYNTDFAGMEELLRAAGIGLAGRKVLILGTGGTAKTATAVARAHGASEIVLVTRGRGDVFAAPDVREPPPPPLSVIGYSDVRRLHADAGVLLNATPVGMFPDDGASPVDLADFPALKGVVDVIYHPLRTNLVLAGRARGIPSCGGLRMLAAQAVYASALFLGTSPDGGLVDRAYRGVLDEKRNIVLVGMPSSGKTSVGKALAERTGKRFLDTDALIETKAGQTVAEIFRARGERGFRALERATVAEVSKEGGCVVATGGGAVLDPLNLRDLRRNGTVVFLDRPPERLLVTEDRPLSTDAVALARLYRERIGLYETADLHVRADGKTVGEEAGEILEKLALLPDN